MASAVISERNAHQDRGPPLSLSVDTPPSSSPFPSPSSSFLPPPMPGAHEFAVKPPPPGRNARKSSIASKDTPATPIDSTTSAAASHLYPQLSQSRDPSPPPALSPTTPTPSTLRQLSEAQASPPPPIPKIETQGHSPSSQTPSTTTTPTKSTTALPVTPSSPSFSTSLNSSSGNHRDSLTSNRPAPPSPDVSRRASAAPSTSSNRSRSSKSSRPPSTAISRTNSTRKPSGTTTTPNRHSQPSLTTSPQASGSGSSTCTTTNPQSGKRRSLLVRIRDFAFSHSDERHQGLGPDVPKPNRPKTLNRHLRSGSVSSSDGDPEGDEDEEDGEGDDGWGGLKWGLGRFSWQFGASAIGSALGGGKRASQGGTGGDGFPSTTDFARNFVGEGDDSMDQSGDDDGEDEFFDFEDDGSGVLMQDDEGGEEEDEPLYPGLYRAMYAFEPEGTAEMALEEDQVVRVVGRGGGVGWAVVDKGGEEGGGAHALVPESYLEVVRLDGEEDEG